MCLKRPGEFPEPFEFCNGHPTPVRIGDKLLRCVSGPVAVRNYIYDVLPVSVRVQIFGPHCASDVLDFSEVKGDYTRWVINGANNPCRTPDVFEHPGRRGGLLGLGRATAGNTMVSSTVAPLNVATSNGGGRRDGRKG